MVNDRKPVAYPNISASGTAAWIITVVARFSIWLIRPRRLFRSPITSPMCSSGEMTSVSMIGSSMIGLHFCAAALNAMLPANLNATSELSTS